MRNAHEDPELLSLARRYVMPGRRYLKLGGGLLQRDGFAHEEFLRELREDARSIGDEQLGVLLEGGWRERRTATWLVAVSRRTGFRERIGELLLASEVCCTGLAYCVALSGFGSARDAELLVAHLDRYLRRPDLAYDQPVAMSALLVVDEKLGTDQAGRFLEPGGLWARWVDEAPHLRGPADPAGYLGLVRGLCGVVDTCAGAG